MKVGIIGAGITGLTAACELLKSGHEVVVIESDEQLGGLAGVVKLEEKYVERYYHHFFKTEFSCKQNFTICVFNFSNKHAFSIFTIISKR